MRPLVDSVGPAWWPRILATEWWHPYGLVREVVLLRCVHRCLSTCANMLRLTQCLDVIHVTYREGIATNSELLATAGLSGTLLCAIRRVDRLRTMCLAGQGVR